MIKPSQQFRLQLPSFPVCHISFFKRPSPVGIKNSRSKIKEQLFAFHHEMFRALIFLHIPKHFSSSQLFQRRIWSLGTNSALLLYLRQDPISSYVKITNVLHFQIDGSTTYFIQKKVSIGLETANVGNASWGNSKLENIAAVTWKTIKWEN